MLVKGATDKVQWNSSDIATPLSVFEYEGKINMICENRVSHMNQFVCALVKYS